MRSETLCTSHRRTWAVSRAKKAPRTSQTRRRGAPGPAFVLGCMGRNPFFAVVRWRRWAWSGATPSRPASFSVLGPQLDSHDDHAEKPQQATDGDCGDDREEDEASVDSRSRPCSRVVRGETRHLPAWSSIIVNVSYYAMRKHTRAVDGRSNLREQETFPVVSCYKSAASEVQRRRDQRPERKKIGRFTWASGSRSGSKPAWPDWRKAGVPRQ